MKSVTLTAYPRTLARRTGVKKLRTAGRVPAVIYGRYAPPQNLELDRKAIEDLIHHSVSENMLVDLGITGDARDKRLAMLKDVQHHPLEKSVLHVDFQEVHEDEKVTVMVPVQTVGDALGVKAGGVIEHVLHKLKLCALPKDLPETLIIDVSHLEIGKAVHIGEIKPPAGVTVLGDKNIPVVAVAAPLTEAQELAATEEAAATGEVEMIKEKKEEGEEGAAPAKGAAKAGEKAPAAAGDKKAPAAAAKAPEKKK